MRPSALPDDVAGFADRARAALDPVHWDFFAGGAGEERTLRDNEAAFRRRRVIPRVLRGTGKPDMTIDLYGGHLPHPLLIAPTAFHLLAHPLGERGTAEAAARTGTPMVVSMAATQPIEHLAESGATLWFQLYPQPDRDFQRHVVRRVERAGVRALVVTVDSPVFGRHARDRRNGFTDLPPGLACANMSDATGRIRDIAMDETLSWDHLDRLRDQTRLPVLVKGVLHPADADEAVAHGVDGIVVSNHGGRQLDGVIATVDALPAVAKAVAGRVPVFLDGGIRHGVDVLVALALGATAVLVGRPVVWGLAAAGPDGVRTVLDLLRAELEQALALAGAQRTADLSPELIA